MRCRECQEMVAAAARGGEGEPPAAALPAGVGAHLARCGACREFREQLAVVSAALAGWEAPRPSAARAVACKAALTARFAGEPAPAPAMLPAPSPAEGRAARLFRHPGLIGVLGAAASAAGVAVAPAWVQQVAIGWAAGAAVLTTLVLLCHGRPVLAHGGRT